MQADLTVTVELPRVGSAVSASEIIWRVRTFAVCAALSALAFIQAPGLIVPDTKVDLTVNPVGWLAHALHLWNPDPNFGGIQNQSYGYLWPMGPFFVAGSWLGVPEWVVQRLWWALLFCVAYLGLVALARRMGVGTPATRMVAGVAFALSPRIISVLGSISIEAWPMAVAPWVLVPLIGLARGASIRRAVILSALAVACAGGVNATAVLAITVLPALWLAMLRPLRRRVIALGAWCLAVVAATAWWVAPLLILGRFSPPFLDYVETAPVTTQVTDLVTVLRGASHWQAYFAGIHGAIWPAGFRLVTEPLLIMATIVVAALGLAGLCRRGMPHRRFLVTGLLVGAALVGLGHVALIEGAFAPQIRSFLDGVGAPLRNVHKFDVALRIPLVLGLAHLLAVLVRARAARPAGHSARGRAAVATAAALAAVGVAASPAIAGEIPPPGSYTGVPAYWHEASAWLNQHLDRDRVLVLPSARFPSYLWGSSAEEVTQPLLDAPWAARNSIPLTPPTTIRYLDAIEASLASGNGSPALADVLARSGIRYVLLRADLNYGRSGALRPAVIRQALASSPGLSRVTTFGPLVGVASVPGSVADFGLDAPTPSLEVFEVKRPVAAAVVYPVHDVSTVVGGPESLIDLAAAGLLSDAPTILGGDAVGTKLTGPVLVTDGLRRREVTFGLLHDNASATMTADEQYLLPMPAHDYLPTWADGRMTVARYLGITRVTASTSWGSVQPLGGGRPAHQPFAAIDGDPTTSWRATPGTAAAGQWLEVDLETPRTVESLRVRVDLGADNVPTRLLVTAGAAAETVDVVDGVADVEFSQPSTARRIRVGIAAAVPVRVGTGAVGIAEVELPGVRAERTLVTPAPPAGLGATAVVLSAAPATASCFVVDDHSACAAGERRESEDGTTIDRTVRLAEGALYTPSVWVRPRVGAALDALLDREVARVMGRDSPTVTASSRQYAEPAGRPGVVVDGDPTTAWSPTGTDGQPWLKLTWPKPQTIAGLRLGVDARVAGARPQAVTVAGGDGTRAGVIAANGVVVFDRPVTANEITVFFGSAVPGRSYNPYENRWDSLPIAIGEVEALSPSQVRADEPSERDGDARARRLGLDTIVHLPCGSGPTVHIGGVELRTAVTASLRELRDLGEVAAQPCGSSADARARLPQGETRVVATASDLAVASRVALRAVEADVTDVDAVDATIDRWDATRRTVTVPAATEARILAVRENTNAGWQATLDGQPLRSIVVDGWQQGWIVPAGAAGAIELTYAPDGRYRGGLVIGGGLLLVLIGLGLPPGRKGGVHAAPGYRIRRPEPWVLPAVVGGIALITVGGLAALVLGTAAVAAAVGMRSRQPGPASAEVPLSRAVAKAGWLLPATLLVVAGWLSITTTDPRVAAEPALVAIAAVTAAWISVAVPRRRRGQRMRTPQRWMGRSTR